MKLKTFLYSILGMLFISIIIGVVYIPIYKAPFFFDDYEFLIEWPVMHSLENIPLLLQGALPDSHVGGYRPLRTVYQAISYHFFAAHSVYYHIQSVFIHCINTILIFFIIQKLGTLFFFKSQKSISFIAALTVSILFGIHPTNTEPVAFIQASFDTMGVIFFLLSYLSSLYALDKSQIISKNFFSAITVCFAMIAFLYYELTFTLPFIIGLTIFFVPKQSINKKLQSTITVTIPIIVTLVLLFVLRYAILQIPTRNISSPGNWFTFLLMTRAILTYISHTIFPFQDTYLHEIATAVTSLVGDPEFYTKLKITDTPTLIFFCIAIFLFFLTIFLRKKNPLLSLSITWFFVGLTPVLNIFPSGTVYAERYLYISLISFSLGLYSIIMYLYSLNKKTALKIIILFITLSVIILSGKTCIRLTGWQSPAYLWEKEAKALPKIGAIRNALAVEYRRNRNIPKALEQFKEAFRLQPFEPSYYLNAALAAYELGQYKESAEYARQAFILQGDKPDIYKNTDLSFLINLFDKLKDPKKTQQILKEITAYPDANPEIYYILGNVSLKLGETATAEASYVRAINKNPQYKEAYANLSALYNYQKTPEKTIILLTSEIGKQIESPDLLYNLSVAYKMIDNIESAKITIERAKESNPFDQSIIKLYNDLHPNEPNK